MKCGGRGRLARRGVAIAALAALLAAAACSSSGTHVDNAARSRVQQGFRAIETADGITLNYSIQAQSGSENPKVLACLALEVEPKASSPHGARIYLGSLGSDAALSVNGGCLGGGTDFRDGYLADGYAYLPTSQRPKGTTACPTKYRPRKVTAAALRRIEAQTKSRGSLDLPKLLDAAEDISPYRNSIVTIHLSPEKAVKVARAAGATSTTRPDSETMIVGFSGKNVSSVEVKASKGGYSLITTATYSRINQAQQVVVPSGRCVTAVGPPLTDPTEFINAIYGS